MNNTTEVDQTDLREQMYERLYGLYNRAKYEEAIASSYELLRENPQDAVVLYLQAMAYRRLKQYEEAEESARQILAAYPDMAAGLDVMGQICSDKDEFDQAAVFFERCIEREPESPSYRYSLASALYNGLDRNRATGRLWSRNEIQPAYLSRVNRAIEMLHEANRLQPDDPQQYRLLGLCFDALGKPAEALEHLKTAIVLDSAQAGIHANLAFLYMRYGDLRSAKSHSEQALMLDPHLEEGLNAQQTLDAYQQNPKEYYRLLKNYWKQLCSVYPEDPANWLTAIQLQLEFGIDRPIKELKAYLQLKPEDLEMQVTYGKMLYEEKRYLAAVRHFRELERLFPDNAAIQSWLETLSRIGKSKLYTTPIWKGLYRCLIHYPYLLLILLLGIIFAIFGLFKKRQ
ncbi:tetratricopeptide repeat protein [Brevibacillus sp. B_LB10_24]|uniref:tetratricopeptide repeat protein n=1 Tax=Brevibacillus sp. B_LB10_24 TaxID=3380645 RepID=UPI0038B913CE